MLSFMPIFFTDNILPKCEIQNKQFENEVALEGFKSQNLEVGKKNRENHHILIFGLQRVAINIRG